MDRIDIVYVFGAGSVQGAWDPVLRAVEKMVHHPVGHEVANWWFGLQGSFTHLIASWGRPAAQVRAQGWMFIRSSVVGCRTWTAAISHSEGRMNTSPQ